MSGLEPTNSQTNDVDDQTGDVQRFLETLTAPEAIAAAGLVDRLEEQRAKKNGVIQHLQGMVEMLGAVNGIIDRMKHELDELSSTVAKAMEDEKTALQAFDMLQER